MKKAGIRWLCIAVAAVIAVTAAVGLFLTFKSRVIVDGKLYPKGQAMLDLRGNALSAETYDKLTAKLPGTTVLWQVPFQGRTVSSSTEELTVTALSMEDEQMLRYFPNLKTLWAEECPDYEALAQAYRDYPDCDVEYLVPIEDAEYPSFSENVALVAPSEQDVQRLSYLPNLKTVDGTQCRDYARMQQLQQDRPDLTVRYAITVGGTVYPTDTQVLEAANASYAELEGAISVMPQLTEINLTDPVATGEELVTLRENHPELTVHWTVNIGSASYADDAQEVDISGTTMESTETAKAYAAYFPELTKLIMSDCGIDDETMAQFREEMRDQYKVVWTVYFTKKCKARTDEESFMPIKQGEWYFQDDDVGPLKYCEDMIAIDIGHSRVRDISFAAYMPHLKYLILADTDVRDLTPLSNCKELVWLEVGWDAIESYEPLLGCTALEDLNIGRTFADPAPIYQMTWLKNLWCMEISGATQYGWRMALPNTNVVGKGNDVVAYGWRRLPNYYKMRDALGMYYMD